MRPSCPEVTPLFLQSPSLAALVVTTVSPWKKPQRDSGLEW
jgi:hypothetical protein